MISPEFLKFIENAKLPPLTNTQHRFAEWLLLEENRKIIGQLGNLDDIFVAVRKYVKQNNKS